MPPLPRLANSPLNNSDVVVGALEKLINVGLDVMHASYVTIVKEVEGNLYTDVHRTGLSPWQLVRPARP